MVGLDISLSRRTTEKWWPDGAIYAADFINDRYMIGGAPVTAAEAYTVTRSTPKFAQDAAGIWHRFAANVPARTNLGLNLEQAVEYAGLNSTFAGAVPGIIGSGGQRPTGWGAGTSAGLSMQIVGTGNDGDIPYIRIRIFGVSTSTDFQWMFDDSTIIAAPGQTWTGALMVRLVAGSLSGITPALRLAEQNLGTFLTSTQNNISIGTMFAYASVTRTVTNAAANRVRLRLRLVLQQIGQSVDATFDMAAPGICRSEIPTSPFLTSSLNYTRSADMLSVYLPENAETLIGDALSGPISMPVPSGSFDYPPILAPTTIRLLAGLPGSG